MKEINAKKVTPESQGICSKDVLDFLKTFDEYGLYTHSVLMAKGDNVITETYYKPFDKNTLLRQYSVSKSFVSMAVGLALTEKLLSLEDKIIDYFPEYINSNVDEFYRRCTIKDMLKMSSNIGTNVYWWGKFDTRTGAYYSQRSLKSPNSIFYYDSIGSFLLGNIIQKLTGKDFLQYLKEKVLLELGFSKESYVLKEPGGYAVGDSAVMCTMRDLFVFARLIAKGGKVNGKQYIDKDYIKEATTVQSKNDLYSDFRSFQTFGYGYLIWIIENGFALFGAGDQLVFYNRQKDFTLVIQSDNQGTSNPQHLLYHEFNKRIIPKISDRAIPDNNGEYQQLIDYENNAKLLVQYGSRYSKVIKQINGLSYKSILDNQLNITEFKFDFYENGGKFTFIKDGKTNSITFGFGHNELIKFSFGSRAKADMMGVNVEGEYDCASSAGFIDENLLAIKVQVIDTYAGKLQITAHFSKDEANLFVQKHGQYVFDGIGGYVCAKAQKGENI